MSRRLFDLRDDRGIALVSALGVMLVVSLLSVVTVSLSFHNVERSATNRERVKSVAAAEAGLNRMFAHLETVTPATIGCSLSESLTTDGSSSFVATLHVEGAAGELVPMSCPPVSIPPRVVIRSVGRSIGSTPERTMESLVDLVPIPSGLFGDDAIFSNRDMEIRSNTQIEGHEGGDANIYSNASITLDSNTVVAGSAYAQDRLTLRSTADVKRDVWARNAVLVDTNSIVRGNTRSSTSSIVLDSNAHVFGDAEAGTSITVNGTARLDGVRISDAPTGPPPEKPFPTFVWDPVRWEGIGYDVATFPTCTEAKAFIGNISSGNHVVRITDRCDLRWDGNATVAVRGNLAIVHNGSVTLQSNSRFTSVGGPHNLFFIVGLGGTAPCDFETRSNSSIGGGLVTLIYTPCRALFNSNSFVVEGQVYAGQPVFNSNVSLTYRPVQGPGGTVSGYLVEPVYTREVRGTHP